MQRSSSMQSTPSGAKLLRKLGLAAVGAIVAGDMLGSGIFFTPGQLASIATKHWQVYFIWALAGGITLCGALTLAELTSKIPESGSSFYIIREAYGPFWGFVKIWTEMLIGGPASVAGVAIIFGQFFMALPASGAVTSPSIVGVFAILFFAIINLMGVQWGGRTQIALTSIKIAALLGLVFGSILLAAPTQSAQINDPSINAAGIFGMLQVIGLGVSAVVKFLNRKETCHWDSQSA
jgi:APA family basic amino acid/polyamine antiporter